MNGEYDLQLNQEKTLKILVVETANMNLGDNVIGDNVYYLLKRALRGKRYDILRYSISLRDPEQVRYVDAVVFAGGILKSTTEKFWLYITELIKTAQEYQVPVLLSGIGVEAFYPDDERSVNLKEAINLPCVKAISVRDDIETLKRDYITNPEIRVTPVFDHAIWCSYTYREYLKKQQKMVSPPPNWSWHCKRKIIC